MFCIRNTQGEFLSCGLFIKLIFKYNDVEINDILKRFLRKVDNFPSKLY